MKEADHCEQHAGQRKTDACQLRQGAGADDRHAEQDDPDREEQEPRQSRCEQCGPVDVVVDGSGLGHVPGEVGASDGRLREGRDAEDRCEERVADDPRHERPERKGSCPSPAVDHEQCDEAESADSGAQDAGHQVADQELGGGDIARVS